MEQSQGDGSAGSGGDDLLAEGHWLPLIASMGVAIFPSRGQTVAALIRSADRALYSAKEEGRNRVGAAVG